MTERSGYPYEPGYRKGPHDSTSKAAAEAVAPAAKTMLAKIMEMLEDVGTASPEELTTMFEARGERVLLTSVRARVCQAHKRGWLRPSGDFGRGESNRCRVIKWAVVPLAERPQPAEASQ